MSRFPNVSLVREAGAAAVYLVVGDTKFWITSPAEANALMLDLSRVRPVDGGALSHLVERRLHAPPTARPSQVFFDCGRDFDSFTGRWHFNCKEGTSLVRRDVLIAGWVDQPYVNKAAHGVEDVHYNVRLDAVFLERMYGPGGLSTALQQAFYPGNPAGPAAIMVGEPPTTAGQPREVTLNSFILPGSSAAMHCELNAWHQHDTGAWFSRHFVGRGPAPAHWINPLSEDTDAWFPFDPLDPETLGVRLRAEDYIVMRGPLWQDTWHDGITDPWNTGPTLNHAWPEIHPVDWICRARSPGAHARETPGSIGICTPGPAGDPESRTEQMWADFEPSSITRRLQVRSARARTDTRLTVPSSVVSVTTAVADDHVDVGASVRPTGTSQGRFKGSWRVGWREIDVHDRPWVDDALPAGAQPAADVDTWDWGPEPYAGTVCHRSVAHAGIHQHYFVAPDSPMRVDAGDVLFAMVRLDPVDPPEEVMLQWHTSGWMHRAYWGADRIGWGAAGTAQRLPCGRLPFAGEWARLEVPAAAVGLEGQAVTGMAFTLFGGRAAWDYAGVRATVFVSYGARLKLRHAASRVRLHSHPLTYRHPATSGQQQVTGFADTDPNDVWQVKGPHGQPESARAGQPVAHGDVVRLTHVATGRNLHSHAGFPSPLTQQQEVTGFGSGGVGDGNDDWRVEVGGGGRWASDATVRLIHVPTGAALHSHAGWSHPLYTSGQQEVTAYAGRDGNDLWTIGELDANLRGARFVSQSIASPMVTGRAYEAAVSFRNTGTETWTAAAQHRLGSQSPPDNATWGRTRVELPGPVGSGEEVTFRFTLTAPAVGAHRFRWRMLREGVEWFGDATADVVVHVAAAGDCTQIRQQIAAARNSIGALRQALGGLDPRDLADRNEIRDIRRRIGELEAQLDGLQRQATALGCP